MQVPFMNDNPSILKRFFSSVWKIVNLSRLVILNILFFILFFTFIGLLSSGDKVIEVPNKTALVLNLVGNVVEQKRNIDPMEAFLLEASDQPEENPEMLLSDILDVIVKAKNDDRVSIIVLQLQGLGFVGLSKLQQIAFALEDFKTAGKQIIATADQYSQDQYYLASTADDIWLNPKGFMLLDGFGRYRMYFKSALEKLAINQHIFRVGTFKSAVEPYIRDDMSEAAQQANKLWLTDLWSQYKTDVAQRRDFSIDNFDENIDSLLVKLNSADGNFATYAVDNNWVDQLKSREQVRTELIDLVGKNSKGDSFSQISYKDYISATSLTIDKNFAKPLALDKVAIIVAKGTILDGTQDPGTIGGDSTAKLLQKARYNRNVKAVVLRVDSPGGSAYASEIIRQEVELLKAAGKPVVASMGTYAASGGYWISASADKIFASPATITGSIGIYGMFMTFEDSLSKLGIHTDGVGTTDIAGFGVTRALTPGMASLFQATINRGYNDFLQLVAKNRNMTVDEVDNVAQGRVWTGKKAKELGLVDELGTLNDAVVAAAVLANIEQYDTLVIEKEQSPSNKLIQQLLGQSSQLIAVFNNETALDTLAVNASKTGPFSQIMSLMTQQINQMNQFNDPQGRYMFCNACSVN
jgi:protease-4